MRFIATLAAAAALSVVPALADISIEEAIAIARDNGIVEFHEVELDRGDGEWEIEGLDADGRKMEIDIDLASGEIRKIEHD